MSVCCRYPCWVCHAYTQEIMTLSALEHAVQRANPAWKITIQLAYPEDGDPVQSAPIVLTATRCVDGYRYWSASYARPQHVPKVFIAAVSRDLQRAATAGTVPPRWIAVN